jgi:hypothetical protein
MKESILQLRAAGQNYDEIATALNCSKGTVAWHCSERVRAKYLQGQRQRRKAAVTELKTAAGGKCVICGYARCLEVLHFHHKDTKTKSRKRRGNGKQYGVTALLSTTNRTAAYQEAEKCVLLCANCHGEVHAGVTKFT